MVFTFVEDSGSATTATRHDAARSEDGDNAMDHQWTTGANAMDYGAQSQGHRWPTLVRQQIFPIQTNYSSTGACLRNKRQIKIFTERITIDAVRRSPPRITNLIGSSRHAAKIYIQISVCHRRRPGAEIEPACAQIIPFSRCLAPQCSMFAR